ncbi:MAG: hypothetical protein HOV87_04490 [Catenulispora sp.]|nr:hypothetical protein [Catenulispora sp.]
MKVFIARLLVLLVGAALSSGWVQDVSVSAESGGGVGGCISLQDMGVPGFDVTREITKSSQIGSAEFSLPSDAAQGPKAWYVLHFHVAVIDTPGSAGTADVSASTNGATAAHVVLNPGVAGGVDWSTGGIAEPDQRGHSADGAVEVHMANYLQFSGVKAGRNTIEFQAEAFGSSKLGRVHVFPDTCLEKTDKSPDQVQLSTHVTAQHVTVGTNFSVQVKLHNQGSGAILGARVLMQVDGGGIAPASNSQVQVPELTTDWSGQLDFKALAAGNHTLQITVSTAARPNLGGTTLLIPVAKHTRLNVLPWIAAVIAVLFFALGYRLLRSARS